MASKARFGDISGEDAGKIESAPYKTSDKITVFLCLLQVPMSLGYLFFVIANDIPWAYALCSLLVILVNLSGVVAERKVRQLLVSDGPRVFSHKIDSKTEAGLPPFNKALAEIWRPQFRMLGGIIYSTLVITTAYVGFIDPDQMLARLGFALTLVPGNLVAGGIIYSAGRLGLYCITLVRNTRISIWNLRTSETDFVLNACRVIGIWAAPYIALASGAAAVAPFSQQTFAFVYFGSILAIFTIIILLPFWPIVRRAQQHKAEICADVEHKLAGQIHLFSDVVIAGDKPREELARIETLIKLRADISDLPLIPMKTSTLVSLVYVAGAALLPVIIQGIADALQLTPGAAP